MKEAHVKTRFITLLSVVLMLAGCGKIEEENANALESASKANAACTETSVEETKAVTFAPEEQLAVIENSFDIWKENNDDINAVKDYIETKYAIADMDKDGYLEVIKETYGKVSSEKDEVSAFTTFYEVTEEHSIEQLNMDSFRKLKFEPAVLRNEMLDIIDDNTYRVYSVDEHDMHEYYRLSFDHNSVILDKFNDEEQGDYYDVISSNEMISVFKEVNSETLKTSYDKHYQRKKEDKTGNYTDFLNNEIKAKVDCDDYMFESEEKEEYSLEELKNLAANNIYSGEGSYDFDYEYIDCGCDGENELVINIGRGCETYSFVLKDEGDGLFIRYIAEDADRFREDILKDGYVCGFGKGGASLAMYDYGFLDKDSRYHVFYTCLYYLALDSGMAGIKDQEVLDDNQLLVYSFEMFKDGKEEGSMCLDGCFADPEIKKAFIDDGYKFYSKKEIKERLLKRADEIGISKLGIDEWRDDINREFDDDEN